MSRGLRPGRSDASAARNDAVCGSTQTSGEIREARMKATIARQGAGRFGTGPGACRPQGGVSNHVAESHAILRVWESSPQH